METLSDLLGPLGNGFKLGLMGDSSYETFFSSAPPASVRGRVWAEKVDKEKGFYSQHYKAFEKAMKDPK